jgi:hypothetical protein
MTSWSLLLERSGFMYVRPYSPTYDVVFRMLTRSLKVVLHGEPPKGKAFTIECIYMFTLVEHLGIHKVKGVIDFLDSRAFIEMNEGN